jgi:hypothetical protein
MNPPGNRLGSIEWRHGPCVVTERLSAFVPAQAIMRRTIGGRSPDGKTAATMKKPNARL